MLEQRIRDNSVSLNNILETVKLLDENELPHLYELHDLYVEAMRLTDELMSDTLYMKDTAYTERKHEQSQKSKRRKNMQYVNIVRMKIKETTLTTVIKLDIRV